MRTKHLILTAILALSGSPSALAGDVPDLTWDSADLDHGLVFRLYALNPGSTPGNRKLGEAWGESEITWNNAPASPDGSLRYKRKGFVATVFQNFRIESRGLSP